MGTTHAQEPRFLPWQPQAVSFLKGPRGLLGRVPLGRLPRGPQTQRCDIGGGYLSRSRERSRTQRSIRHYSETPADRLAAVGGNVEIDSSPDGNDGRREGRGAGDEPGGNTRARRGSFQWVPWIIVVVSVISTGRLFSKPVGSSDLVLHPGMSLIRVP